MLIKTFSRKNQRNGGLQVSIILNCSLMDFFNLPARAKVGRVVPKNAFDEYTNTKQKKLFTDCILRITWTHKLSADMLNLDTKDIQEIQDVGRIIKFAIIKPSQHKNKNEG